MAKFILCAALSLILPPVDADHSIVFVKQPASGVEELLSQLHDRSNPNSDRYLEWMSQEQVASLLHPEPHHLSSVLALAEKYGAHTTIPLGGQDKLEVHFPGPVPMEFLRAAEELEAVDFVASAASASFNVTLGTIQRSSRNLTRPPPVANDSRFDGNATADPQKCLSSLDGVSPTCLRTAYGLDSADQYEKGMSLEGQAFVVNQAFLQSDLAQFQSEFKLQSNPVAHVIGKNSGAAGDEASLDSQWITTTGAGVPTTFVYIDGSMSNPFTDWLVWAGNASDSALPKVHSLSVGAPENEVGDGIMSRMNTDMAALGVRGVSIVFASGDSGYQPVQKYGAASPYVVSVGGIFNGELRNSVLQADSLTTGGFSSTGVNKAQDWQAAAIKSYQKNRRIGTKPHIIDPTRRAVPDVSAYDDDIAIVQNGAVTSIGGTSAACPIVAGMLAKINEALAAAGHSTSLGYVNPLLYANEAAFLDIKRGSNHGIDAVEGYDPVSGLGTFSPTTFSQLKAAALKAADRAKSRRVRTN